MKPRDPMTSCFMLVTFVMTSFSGATAVLDYCQFEMFNATCGEGTLVMMLTARYGRMRTGRCLDTEAHLGCSTDVLIFMDSQCSGKPSCLFQLPVDVLYRQQNCPKDVYAYLEASFTCVTVSGLESRSCTNSDSVRISNLEEGHLASYSSQNSMQGTQSCPWKIFMKPGQQIQLTLYDFSVANRYKSDADKQVRVSLPSLESSDYCHVYATVDEPDVDLQRRSNICARNSREREVYTSASNHVVIEVSELVVVDLTISFIIKFRATGCPNYQLPKHSWAERTGDKLIVRCNGTQQSWHMICRGTSWVGQTSECDQDIPVGEKVVDDGVFPTYGLVIAVIVGIFVGSLCGFVLLAIVLWCRRQTSVRALSSSHHHHFHDGEVELSSSLGDVTDDNVCKIHRLPTGEYGYTHVWKVRNTQLPLVPTQNYQQQQQQLHQLQQQQQQQQHQHCLQQSHHHHHHHYAATAAAAAAAKEQLRGDCCSKSPSILPVGKQQQQQQQQVLLLSSAPHPPGSPNAAGLENLPRPRPLPPMSAVRDPQRCDERRRLCQHVAGASKQQLQQLDVIDNAHDCARDCPLFDERFLVNERNNNNNNNSDNSNSGGNNHNSNSGNSCNSREMISFKPVTTRHVKASSNATAMTSESHEGCHKLLGVNELS